VKAKVPHITQSGFEKVPLNRIDKAVFTIYQ